MGPGVRKLLRQAREQIAFALARITPLELVVELHASQRLRRR
jgi:hypothetical protein